MAPRPFLSLALASFLALAQQSRAQDFIDRMDDFMTINLFHGNVRAKLRGLLDLEAYSLSQPPPGLIDTNRHFLFNPRLTTFLDVQAGPYVYGFAQLRVDRGFDPSDGTAQARMDEYAIRISPWEDGRLSVQFGKFGAVVGNWIPRHYSWEDPFITAPGPYGNLTGAWDSAAATEADDLLYWGNVRPKGASKEEYPYDASKSGRYYRLPIIWGPSYTSGVSVMGKVGKFEYAAEMKNASLSSRPETWDLTETTFEYPTFSSRLGYRPNATWNFGISGSTGVYLTPDAAPTLPPGHAIGDYREWVLGQDASFEWRHIQLWAEIYEARFEVPNVGNADTLAYYVEGKYKITPQLFAALRWNHQLYADIPYDGIDTPWGNNLWRIDASIGYRFTTHTQLKVQYSLEHEDGAPVDLRSTVAGQLTLRF
jgi:hypothetical protein